MDNEEFEQIPWSSLVTDKAEGVDRRVYIAVGVVGVIVAVIFGSRLLGGSQTQPIPPPEAAPVVQPTQLVTSTSVGMIVTEADLMASQPASVANADDVRYAAFAEWFVTDFYTTDGSSQSAESARALMAASASKVALPHSSDPPPATTYVEWARSLGVRPAGEDAVEVEVVYRTITETKNGFIRDPMAAVVVTMRVGRQDPGVIGEPVQIPVPPLVLSTNDETSAPEDGS